jgi:hypothetical protein
MNFAEVKALTIPEGRVVKIIRGTQVLWNSVVSPDDSQEIATFAIIDVGGEGTNYQVEEGMTWRQWVNSKYNTDGFWISEDTNSVVNLDYREIIRNSVAVTPDETVVSNTLYSMSHTMIPI